KKILPAFMPMGNTGMGGMRRMYTKLHMPIPPNFQPPEGAPGQFGEIDMSGMFTIVKVRDGITSYADPGWYQNPPRTVAGPWPISKAQQDKAP
ncbi:MAG: copper oxidase, partial [Verrucomicrobia bacterium]|nr:copper oxidase [Verrucomicrobiota bacterium]